VSENQIQKCNFSSYLDKYTDQMDLPKQVEWQLFLSEILRHKPFAMPQNFIKKICYPKWILVEFFYI
jgi:hypothetical protein